MVEFAGADTNKSSLFSGCGNFRTSEIIAKDSYKNQGEVREIQ